MNKEPREVLADWMGSWTSDEVAARARGLQLNDHSKMLRVAHRIVDCVIREILSLPQPYGSLSSSAWLLALDPIVDDVSRQAAKAALRTLPGKAAGSAEAALSCVDDLATGSSPEKVDEAWTALFYPMGPLYMAVSRTHHMGASSEAIRGVLVEAIRSLHLIDEGH